MVKLSELVNKDERSSLVADAMNIFIVVFTFFLLSRFLSIEDLGHWSLFMSYVVICDMLRTGLVKQSFIYFYNQKISTARELIGSAVSLSIILSLFISVIFYLILLTVDISSQNLSLFLLLYPLITIIDIPFSLSQNIYHAELKFTRILKIKLISRLSFLSLVILKILFANINFMNSIIFFISSQFLASIYCIYIKRKELFSQLNLKHVKTLLNYGRFSVATILSTQILKNSDLYLIAIFLDTPSVALYAVALKTIDIIDYPFRSIMNARFPALSSLKKSKGFRNTFSQDIIRFMILTFAAVGVLFILSDTLILTIYGEKFSDSVSLFQVFLIYCILVPIDKYCGVILDSINMPKFNFYKVLLMLLLNLAGDYYVLVNNYPLLYVGYISVIVYACGIFMSFLILHSLKERRPA